MKKTIQNPGSALGEAIGAEMERALNAFLEPLVEEVGYHFISKGLGESKTGKQKKLLMYDKFGTAYNIDSVIANSSMQPVILVESKYIRYKKHNRDKGSWICTAHPALRRRYTSIRSSIAVLAGNWSSSSLAMMNSYDINIFLIPFERIRDLLFAHDIEFNWLEKDRKAATSAWNRYVRLPETERASIGASMVDLIKDDLGKLILKILDDSTPREISKVAVELHSNIGEVKTYEFPSVTAAVDFPNTDELKQVFRQAILRLFSIPSLHSEMRKTTLSSQLDSRNSKLENRADFPVHHSLTFSFNNEVAVHA